MFVKGVPCALPRARPGLSTGGVRGLGMLIANPERIPLAYGPENVLGLSLAGLVRAFRVIVRQVGPRAGLV